MSISFNNGLKYIEDNEFNLALDAFKAAMVEGHKVSDCYFFMAICEYYIAANDSTGTGLISGLPRLNHLANAKKYLDQAVLASGERINIHVMEFVCIVEYAIAIYNRSPQKFSDRFREAYQALQSNEEILHGLQEKLEETEKMFSYLNKNKYY
jgi:hypothetical protein